MGKTSQVNQETLGPHRQEEITLVLAIKEGGEAQAQALREIYANQTLQDVLARMVRHHDHQLEDMQHVVTEAVNNTVGKISSLTGAQLQDFRLWAFLTKVFQHRLKEVVLIQAIKEGGRPKSKAIKELYADETLKGVVNRMVQHSHYQVQEGQDLVSEAVVSAVRKIESLDGVKLQDFRLWAFLTKVCRNRWYKQIKRRNHFYDIVGNVKRYFFGAEAPTYDRFQSEMLSKVQWAAVEHLLQGVKQPDRSVVELRSQGFSFAEIGKLLGLKEGTARKKNHDVKNELIRRLGGLE